MNTLQKGEKSSRWRKTMKHRQSDEYGSQHHSNTYFITRPDFPDKSLNMQSSGTFIPMTDRTPAQTVSRNTTWRVHRRERTAESRWHNSHLRQAVNYSSGVYLRFSPLRLFLWQMGRKKKPSLPFKGGSMPLLHLRVRMLDVALAEIQRFTESLPSLLPQDRDIKADHMDRNDKTCSETFESRWPVCLCVSLCATNSSSSNWS